MYTLIIVLILLASVLMVGIVLIQESKGGGLASGFSASNQIMGVRKTTDFLEKATWGLAIAMVVLSVVSSAFITKTTVEENPLIEQSAPAQTDAQNVPSFPASGAAETPAEGKYYIYEGVNAPNKYLAQPGKVVYNIKNATLFTLKGTLSSDCTVSYDNNGTTNYIYFDNNGAANWGRTSQKLRILDSGWDDHYRINY